MPAVSMRAALGAAAAATFCLTPLPAGAQTAAPDTPPPPLADAPVPPVTTADPAPLTADLPLAPMPDLGVDWPDLSAPDATAPVAPDAAAALRANDAELARPYRVAITGIDELGANFRLRFNGLSALAAGNNKPANAAQINRRLVGDEDLMRQLLRAVGRYDGTVEGQVDAAATPIAVTLAVTTGRAYHFTTITLPGLDRAGTRTAPLADAFAIRPGDAVDADRVTTEVANYRARLGREGYPFAKVADPQVTVDHATGEATLSLAVDPGAPARFGRILPTGTRPVFSAHHLGEIARFHEGQEYDAARLDDLRRALIQTSLVSVATITPVPAADPAVVDIQVLTEPAPPRTIAGELGYGTGEGARAELSWQHRNLLPPEGAVTFRGIAGTREQLLSATLRRSNYQARDRILNAQIAASHSNLNAYDAKSFSVSADLERQTNIIWQKKWVWSVGGELLASDERDTIQATGADRRRTFFVVAAPATLAYDGTDDLLNPSRSYRIAGRISPEASLHKTADLYVKLQLDASGYWPVTPSIVLAGRIRVASITGANTEIIAPSRRLYSGGGGSVRGFGYQKIGPVDIDGDPVGGRGLVEFGSEARFRFGAFGVVPFLDGGRLTDSNVPTVSHMRYGAGLGARYYTSFGPIRIDVGTPLNRRAGESRIAVYVSLGQAF
ncbi:BamA/TamA family outer membrane protein [Sphingomonas sp. BIUV-7]|uniref:BamA/TamA family outer membrane protein n=1 Tax=Sphingomonas natans TaxID=3063330 RepID=A0ABT8YDG0_9SPHN|nr:BamA/TamA family outer membrane protein [Sphingomonas sp. BIUV-7]MDO6416359.1 BamA/TamA family outer membrane protein [Sphingomonas sp. BIUV-7]